MMRYVILGFGFLRFFPSPFYLPGLSLQPEEAPGFGFFSGFGFGEVFLLFDAFGFWPRLTLSGVPMSNKV